MSEQAVAVVSAADAKARALKLIEANEGAISFVKQEDLETQGIFLPVVSVLKLDRSDFHDISGSMMPKSHHVNRMTEAAGVFIHSVDVRELREFAWIGKATGEKRMPDGTMRPGEQEYLYDAEKRAELDVLNKPDKYNTDRAKRIHLLETAKFGVQRAGTGARLALIRYFCKIPTSFKANEMEKAMLFSRVDVNTDALLADPSMRAATIDHALGARDAIYGPRNVTPAPAQLEAPENEPLEESDDFETAAEPEKPHEDERWKGIIEYEETYKLPKEAIDEIAKARAKDEVDDEFLTSLTARVGKWCDKHEEARR